MFKFVNRHKFNEFLPENYDELIRRVERYPQYCNLHNITADDILHLAAACGINCVNLSGADIKVYTANGKLSFTYPFVGVKLETDENLGFLSEFKYLKVIVAPDVKLKHPRDDFVCIVDAYAVKDEEGNIIGVKNRRRGLR